MEYDFGEDADTTMLEIPIDQTPGSYRVHYVWSGYYDIVDVTALDKALATDIWGSGGQAV